MSKKFVNTGNSIISFGGDDVVIQGETIELSDELLKEKSDAIETLVLEGRLTEKLKASKEPEKPKEQKPKEKQPEEIPVVEKE